MPCCATQPESVATASQNPDDVGVPLLNAHNAAICVCSGFGPLGLPVSLQIVGKPFQEAKVFQIADAFEKATAFRAARPPMAESMQ